MEIIFGDWVWHVYFVPVVLHLPHFFCYIEGIAATQTLERVVVVQGLDLVSVVNTLDVVAALAVIEGTMDMSHHIQIGRNIWEKNWEEIL